MIRRLYVSAVLICLSPSLCLAADDANIAVIDTYGLHKVSQQAVLEAAGIRVGDPVPKNTDEIVARLQAVPGVKRAAVARVTAVDMKKPGKFVPIIYIGIDEGTGPAVPTRSRPADEIVLPDDVFGLYSDFEKALHDAFRRNDNLAESFAEGHSILKNEEVQSFQRKFIPVANQHWERLTTVLRTSKNSAHRAAAAWTIGYADNKQRAAAELIAAARSDPNSTVRNDSMRALAAILTFAQQHPEVTIDVPYDLFIDTIESLEWTDRNKGMAVLDSLAENRDPVLLDKLRQRSLPTLAEMARWHYEGHALQGYLLVAHVAGLSTKEAIDAWNDGRREEVIAAAIKSQEGSSTPAR